MGSVLVQAMMQGGSEELASRKLHPFFSRPSPEAPSPAPTSNQEPQLAPGTEASVSNEGAASNSDGRKKRKSEAVAPAETMPEEKQPQAKRRAGGPQDGSIMNLFVKSTPSKNSEEPRGTLEGTSPAVSSPAVGDASTILATPVQPVTVSEPISNDPAADTQVAHPEQPVKPKKVLKFNPRTGTLGSPPKPKTKASPSRIVTIKYGVDPETRESIGAKITSILDGSLRISSTPTKTRSKPGPKKRVDGTAAQAGPTTKTHPLFGGKENKKDKTETEKVHIVKKSPARRHSVFMSTPVSPRKPRTPFISSKPAPLGYRNAGTKVPGAAHPLWPAQGMSHVRGEDDYNFTARKNEPAREISRKSKGQVVAVAQSESVLNRMMADMDLGSIRNSLPRNEDDFDPAPCELRLPQRHFESGRKLQHRIRRQLCSNIRPTPHYQPGSSPDELSGQPVDKIHPMIHRLYNTLARSLSAYDRSSCENLAWVQKYAPATSAQVLQAGKEGHLLKQWLEALKVQTVDTGNTAADTSKAKSKGDGGVKKRRKKNKLDGFIVDSDEEANEMDEVSEDEVSWSASGPGGLQKTVIRSGDAISKGSKDASRLTNAIVMSGPHGCGKTAAVYAVAQELDFEVFEINSGSRRSGKDLLERVGDMTRNHLVQQHRTDKTTTQDNTEDEVAEDIKSGKQGMMTSFFKLKGPAKKAKAGDLPDGKTKQEQVGKATSSKSQKQSLILLEEVDILYEEDKQFWASLMTLIAQSRRPFIMTCNDESLVPIQSLNLHGIFRFAPPPADLAVDTCLLIAANEGHALQRSAVDALYASRNYDLRATITDLNYWCQIGIGDRRGGFEWFYLRWPKGSDLDEQGDVVRVISEDTYIKGMGWIGRDPIITSKTGLDGEQQALRQTWDFWGMDIGDWEEAIDIDSCAEAMSNETPQGRRGALASLAAYDDFCGEMSDADVCAGSAHSEMLKELLDASLPEIPIKMKDDFTIGRTLLEADPLVQPDSLVVDVSQSLKSLARERLHSFAASHASIESAAPALEPIDEENTVSILDSWFRYTSWKMVRHDLSLAFDPIAVSSNATSTHLEMSIFDRTLRLIVEDVAPWVRGIVASDNQLMRERMKLSSLLSEGGKRKRMRNTRSAFSALEGGERRTTRRERYFGDTLNYGLVMRTAGDTWENAVCRSDGLSDGGTEHEEPRQQDQEQGMASSPGSDDHMQLA